MSLLATFAVLAAFAIFAAACERVWHRVGQIPALVRAATRQARDQGAAGLQEAVAARLGPALQPIAVHQERLVHVLRVELAAAEVRARLAESRAGETLAALEVSTVLVRELRRLLADARLERTTVPAPPAPAPVPLPSTVPPPRRASAAAPEEDGDSRDEVTQVGEWGKFQLPPSLSGAPNAPEAGR